MNTLSRIHRLLAALAAATLTTVVFETVFMISEPQRSELIAKSAERQRMMATPATLQVAQAR
jgi:hypothetical protein